MNTASLRGRVAAIPLTAALLIVCSGVADAGFIQATWTGPFTDVQKGALEQAIANWESQIGSINDLSLELICDNILGANGETLITQTYADHQKQPKAATVKVNNNALWWDPTPAETHDGEIPADKRDALSTAMHELCHALGFTSPGNPGGGFDNHVTGLPGIGLAWSDGVETWDLDDANMTHLPLPGLMYHEGALGVRNVITWDYTYMLTHSYDCYYPVPEPATLLLFGAGLAGLGWRLRRRAWR